MARQAEGHNQGTINLLTPLVDGVGDGDLASATNGESFKLPANYTDVKFGILASDTPVFTATVEQSLDDTNWGLLGTFNGGPISVAKAYFLSPSSGAAVGPFFRLKLSAWTSGQVDQTDKDGASACHWNRRG